MLWQVDSCALAPFTTPKKLLFSRLTFEPAGGEPQYHVRIAYDFGTLPVYVDRVGEVPSSGALNFATPDAVLTFRCGDENGAPLASLDLERETQKFKARAARSNGSSSTMLASAQAAYVLGDTQGIGSKLTPLTKYWTPAEQKGEAYLLLGHAKAAVGDAAGANSAFFTVKRLAGNRSDLAGLSARADLASYDLDVTRGLYLDAQRVASSIDTANVSDDSIRQRVASVQTVASAISFGFDPNGIDPWMALTKVLGEDHDNDAETVHPDFERASKAPWKRRPDEFTTLLQPLFEAIFLGSDFQTIPCPPPPPSPKPTCALSRARQLNHFDTAGNAASYGPGWLARIRFRMVKWDTDASGRQKTNAVDIQYAVTERLAGHNTDPWEPTKTAKHGIESDIETDARRAASRLSALVQRLQKPQTPMHAAYAAR